MVDKTKENSIPDNENTPEEEVPDVGAHESGAGGEQTLSSEEQLAEAQVEIADLRDKLLRTYAEQENFKKRMERERLTALKYAGEGIFKEILPTVDNLERALQQGVVEGADAEQNLKALLEGVQMTLQSLLGSLGKFEVKPVETVGQPFDPQHQEALVMEASSSVPSGHVITEYEKGYFYKDRLLRPAKVIVSSGDQ